MRLFLYILVIIAFVSCKPSGKDFFIDISTNNINDFKCIPTEYRKVREDSEIANSPIIEMPLIDFNVKYRPKNKYDVILFAEIIFHDDGNGFWDSSKNDSVKFYSMILRGKDFNTILYKKGGSINFKKIVIPPDVLYKIREDFLFRMKYTKFNLGKTEVRGCVFTHYYRLW